MTDAALSALLLALDPEGLGGAVVRARPGPERDAWLQMLRDALPDGTPVKRLPPGIADERLLGGLDLGATLALGAPVAATGLLAEADRGVVIVPMAERLPAETAARIALAQDRGEICGPFGSSMPTRFLLILLDEGVDDEQVPAVLAERLAIHIDLDGILPVHPEAPPIPAPDYMEALCAVADALGVPSIRGPLLAVKVARASALLAGRDAVAEPDVATAVRLVLAPRATRLPPVEAEAPSPEQPPEAPPADGDSSQDDREPTLDALTELAIAAARAMLPPGVLELQAGRARGREAAGKGAGMLRNSPRSGRRAGVRQGPLRNGARLDLVETLKAAAPWQTLRRREAPDRTGVLVRRDDFRIRRLVKRAQSTTIFVVDASGSAALARLNEAKGAVELLLAESYVRRDEVALIAFRGETAELLLPPTRSLARAKRALADLPGGGGTPMAAAIEAASLLANSVAAKGRTVTTVFLTDGRANVARAADLVPAEDADSAARALRILGLKAIFIDTSPRPRPEGARLAAAMGARLIALPRADSATLAATVKAA
jgi:magnesium chelatase subunit D